LFGIAPVSFAAFSPSYFNDASVLQPTPFLKRSRISARTLTAAKIPLVHWLKDLNAQQVSLDQSLFKFLPNESYRHHRFPPTKISDSG
jgi:hypothetical protein